MGATRGPPAKEAPLECKSQNDYGLVGIECQVINSQPAKESGFMGLRVLHLGLGVHRTWQSTLSTPFALLDCIPRRFFPKNSCSFSIPFNHRKVGVRKLTTMEWIQSNGEVFTKPDRRIGLH